MIPIAMNVGHQETKNNNSGKIQKCNEAIKNIRESIAELNVTLNQVIKIKNELKRNLKCK